MNKVIAVIENTPSGNGYHVTHGTQKEYFETYLEAFHKCKGLLDNGYISSIENRVFPNK